MGFNHIILDSRTIELLYKDELVSLDPNTSKASEQKIAPSPSLRFLGEHKKRICIFVSYKEVAFLPDQQLVFLSKILDACKMNLGDVAIFNQESPSFHFSEIIKEFQPLYVISFGIRPLDLGLPMDFEPYKIMNYDAVFFLCSNALEELSQENAASKSLKLKLWNCLKQLFAI